MNTLKVISALMNYPDQELFNDYLTMADIVREDGALQEKQCGNLLEFIGQLCANDLMDAQEDYVATFDRGRSLSLLLFEHVHGESRDRGQAMVNLIKVYQENGFDLTSNELPDYLPVFLEYLSQRPDTEIHQWLTDVQHILALLATRLNERNNPYEVLFTALLNLTDSTVDWSQLHDQVATEERDDTADALDKVWEEEAVRFGGNADLGGCTGGMPKSQAHKVSVESIKRATSEL